MQTNYHGHTLWCKHATGETYQVFEKAITSGMKEVAISEHVPQLSGSDFTKMRLQLSEIEDFFEDLDNAIEKYSDQIKIWKALECEYFENSLDWYQFLIDRYHIDFLILGHHFNEKAKTSYFFCKNDEDVLNYQKEVLKALDTGMFSFFAHPDVYLNEYTMTEQARKTAKAIFQKCQELKIPVEINANGLRHNKGYPNREFWKISTDYNLIYLINADSHAISDLDDQAIDKTYQFAEELGITITENIDFNKGE